MRAGTSGLATTDWPRAASVGARIAASRAASQSPSPSGRARPSKLPPMMIRGMPISSIRTGRSWSRRTTRRSIRAASENSTRTRVTSARPWMKPWPKSRSAMSSAAPPITKPKAAKIIGPVKGEASSRRETTPKRTTPAAMIAKAWVSISLQPP